MKILSLDTSTKLLSLCVYDDRKVYEYNIELGRLHSKLLMPSIQRVMEALGLSPKDVDYYSCGIGPGSFTGLRIGVATIKGLAYACDKPVIGISSLDIIARNADKDGVIVPVIDAKRNLVYCSMYRRKNGVLKKISPYRLLSVDECIKAIKPESILLGDALAVYKQKFLKNIPGASFLDSDYWYPQGHNIARWALEKIREKKWIDAFALEPMYLYPKECQIK